MRYSKRTAALAATMTLLAASPVLAAEPAETPEAASAAPSFIPADFSPPTLAEAPGFKLVPLGPELVKVDFDAYMSSIEHLQKTFTRSTSWPHANITDADAMLDMETEQARFRSRESFAYAVLTPDGSRELGSVYVRPSTVGGYDAVVTMWVTKAQYDAGFDARLYDWVVEWVEQDWPFENVAYPGRAIEWEKWDALVAAEAAREKPGAGPLPTASVTVTIPGPARQRNGDWHDAPLRDGSWTYAANGQATSATFATPDSRPRFRMSCDPPSMQVTLALFGIVAPEGSSMIIRTAALERELPAATPDRTVFETVSYLGASDQLLDALTLSNERFAVELAQTSIVLPSSPEMARVIEDCR